MLGSNLSADSGTKTEAGCLFGTPFGFISRPKNFRIGTKAINPINEKARSLFSFALATH
jgi:hypothetical protein